MDSRPWIVVQTRESTRGFAGSATVIWAVAIAVCVFGVRANYDVRTFELTAVIATGALGAYLGWSRRVGSIFFAPVVSWLFGWFPMIVAEMIRDGFFKGFFVGFFLATIGWVAIGAVEFVALFVASVPFRLLPRRGSVVVIDPPWRS